MTEPEGSGTADVVRSGPFPHIQPVTLERCRANEALASIAIGAPSPIKSQAEQGSAHEQ